MKKVKNSLYSKKPFLSLSNLIIPSSISLSLGFGRCNKFAIRFNKGLNSETDKAPFLSYHIHQRPF